MSVARGSNRVSGRPEAKPTMIPQCSSDRMVLATSGLTESPLLNSVPSTSATTSLIWQAKAGVISRYDSVTTFNANSARRFLSKQ